MINLTAESGRMILWHILNWPYRVLVTKYLDFVKIWSDQTKYDSKFGPPPPQTVLREAHAFISVKTETASKMCGDENIDLVKKACLRLIDEIILRVVPATKKELSAATLALRDGEVFSKNTKKNSTRQKFNKHCALCAWHPCIRSNRRYLKTDTFAAARKGATI